MVAHTFNPNIWEADRSQCVKGVVAHTFNPNTWGAERQTDLCEFKENMVYRVNSGTAKDTQRNPV